jgi:hypothetical protein
MPGPNPLPKSSSPDTLVKGTGGVLQLGECTGLLSRWDCPVHRCAGRTAEHMRVEPRLVLCPRLLLRGGAPGVRRLDLDRGDFLLSFHSRVGSGLLLRRHSLVSALEVLPDEAHLAKRTVADASTR